MLYHFPVMARHVFVLVLCLVLVHSQDSWVVHTEYGDVRGFWSEESNVWQFLGMPYAAPPLGSLRFKHPVPPVPWNGILNATENRITCLQTPNFRDDYETEDCLRINVFAPNNARSDVLLPVLFFVHGGGFTAGSGNGYNPYLTTQHAVILVTFNYRVGSNGYLCLGTDRVPGNAALRDSLEALRWVKRNILEFGGDPNSVTAYGESAGSALLEGLLLNTDDLFHRAIIESGSALMDSALSYKRLGLAKAVALLMGHEAVDDLDALGEFYETNSATEVIDVLSQISQRQLACVEKKIEGVENIVKDNFVNTIKSGEFSKIPILFAYTELDARPFSTNFYEVLNELQNEFSKHIPDDLLFTSESEKVEVAEKLKNLYFGESVTNDSFLAYINYRTDLMFFSSIYRSAMTYLEHSDNPIYLMEFSYSGGFNQPNNVPQFIGAAHADIVAHVMDLGYSNNDTLAADQIVRDRMTEMWTNFVKYGDPTPQNSSLPIRWLPFTRNQQHYLSMNSSMEIRQFPRQPQAQLWADIYDKYYYPPPTFTSNGVAGINSLTTIFTLVLTVLITLPNFS